MLHLPELRYKSCVLHETFLTFLTDLEILIIIPTSRGLVREGRGCVHDRGVSSFVYVFLKLHNRR